MASLFNVSLGPPEPTDQEISEALLGCGTQKCRQPPNAVQKTRFLPREFLFLAAALFLIPIP